MNKFFCYFLLFLFLGCSQRKSHFKIAENQVAIGKFRLTLPATYKNVKVRGIDTYVTYYIDDKKDTLKIDYGYAKAIDRLFESPSPVLPMSQKDGIVREFHHAIGPDEAVFSNTPEEDKQQAIFLSEYYMYDTINNLVVKIILPKHTGHGITGIFVPESPDSILLSIRARDLDSLSQMEVVKIFRTLKYVP